MMMKQLIEHVAIRTAYKEPLDDSVAAEVIVKLRRCLLLAQSVTDLPAHRSTDKINAALEDLTLAGSKYSQPDETIMTTETQLIDLIRNALSLASDIEVHPSNQELKRIFIDPVFRRSAKL